MPYSPIASDAAGGAGGTCVLRGCVPKKLFVYARWAGGGVRPAQWPHGWGGGGALGWGSLA